MRNKEATILFHIPFALKANLATEAKNRKLSMTKLINLFITESLKRKVQETGRGHLDIDAIEKTKKYLRKKHPETIRAIDLANFLGKTQARATRLLDYLSGGCSDNENTVTEFLVYLNDDNDPVTYGIFKDAERGIYP